MFSLRRVDREHMIRSKRKSDRLAVKLWSRPRWLIATVLIGNESVNISLSAVMAGIVGATFTGSDLSQALIATALALPLLLFFGEITPKTIAIKTGPTWARLASRPLYVFGAVITPVRWVVRGIAEVAVRPFGGGAVARGPRDLDEAELKALVDAGSADGQVNARERRLIHKVFELSDKTVAQVMLPRERVFALSYDLSLSRLTAEVARRGYSRVPIFHKSLDNLCGVLYAKDLVAQVFGIGGKRPLSELLHTPLFVPQTAKLERLFEIFKTRKIHMALVMNEYGKLAGLVTLEDILEELFGEIEDEREAQKAGARRLPTAGPALVESES